MEGFNKLVEDAWNEAPVDESNAMSNMMKKLKYLKQKIRDWNKGNMKSSKNIKAKLKDDLKAVDDIIDNGEGNDEVVKLRMDVLKSIQDIDKIQSLDAAQKAKIKWSIEGDENSSFYHGVLNKKRSQLNIRGILVDGTWVDNPQRELFENLSCDQHTRLELELEVLKMTKEAVWDCGTDKAPGPDGFTFGFYRRFWKVIENDVFDAVNHFFTYGDIPKGCNSSFIALIPKIPDANVAIHGEDGKVGKQVKSTFPVLDGHKSISSYLYALETCKFVKVAQNDSMPVLTFLFVSKHQGWYRTGASTKLYRFPWSQDEKPCSCVRSLEMEPLENSGDFSCCFCYKELDDKMVAGRNYKDTVIELVPIKVTVMAWKG
ncbi:hypothetical protein Tco_0682543 [Tanacetum coccineum]|uniref:RNA-directed DNA polymerase, eukaryota, reverse transcriptase zinc-binding domain protein n=1 Tax=Tanacetum coccineum TaxID=301880 RepID=A0ABQ4XRF0_9ASTR